jgi:hypothetical protein
MDIWEHIDYKIRKEMEKDGLDADNSHYRYEWLNMNEDRIQGWINQSGDFACIIDQSIYNWERAVGSKYLAIIKEGRRM